MGAMDIPHMKGGKTGKMSVDTAFLGEKVLARTLFNAVVMYEANKRQGTHDTLTRAEVARAKKPLFKQKHTGNARVKHPQVPQCRGGGVAHGPHPREYRYALPRKALRVALRSALLSKFRDSQVIAVESLALSAPKTKDIAKTLKVAGCGASCLIVVREADRNLLLAVRNLPRVKVMSARELNAYEVALHRHVLITEDGLAALKEIHGNA
jgi:large subunit ribosomal protein L4